MVGGNYYNIKLSDEPNDGIASGSSVFLGPASITGVYPDPATTTIPLSQYVRFQDAFYQRTKEAWALFFDATFHASDRLAINVGGRYSEETQRVAGTLNNYCITALAGCTVGAITSTPYNFVSSAKRSNYKKFTPRASIRYEISPRTNVYFSYSQGFRGGEWNGSLPNNDPNLWVDAKQETIDAFELGLKSAGSRLRYDVSAFYYDYKNIQISAVAFVNGVTVTTLQNAPKAKIYGIEGNFEYDVTDNC